VLTDEELEQIRRSLAMAPTLPAGVALRLLEAVQELLAERRVGCCDDPGIASPGTIECMQQRKLTESEKRVRLVKAVVPVGQRAAAVRAASKVKAKAAAFKK
jgi:hypothetical protein